MPIVVFLSVFILITVSALAEDIAEEVYQKKMREQVIPWWKKGKHGTFQGVDNTTLAYYQHIPQPSKEALLILHGTMENQLKYREVAYELRTDHRAIFLIDHRGMGASQRLLPNPHKVHVQAFEDYLEDIKIFYDQVIQPQGFKSISVLGHSLGGSIAYGLASLRMVPIKRMILNSPSFRIEYTPFPSFLIHWIVKLNLILGREKAYVITREDFDAEKWLATPSKASKSVTRRKAEYTLLVNHQKLQVGGPTYGWFAQMLRWEDKFPQYAEEVPIPTLMLLAETDHFVQNAYTRDICAAMPHCHAEEISDSFHEILIEQEPARRKAMNKIQNFLNTK